MSTPERARKARTGRLAKILVVGFLAIVLNSSYLASSVDPTLFHYSNVAFHILAGLALALLLVVYLVKNFRTTPFSITGASVILLIGSAIGAVLVYIYNTHNHRSIFLLHIGIATAGSVLMLWALLMRSRLLVSANFSPVKIYALVAIVAVGLPVATRAYDKIVGSQYRIKNPLTAPESMDGES